MLTVIGFDTDGSLMMVHIEDAYDSDDAAYKAEEHGIEDIEYVFKGSLKDLWEEREEVD